LIALIVLSIAIARIDSVMAQPLLPPACGLAETQETVSAACADALSDLTAPRKTAMTRALLQAGRHDFLTADIVRRLSAGLAAEDKARLDAALALARVERNETESASLDSISARVTEARAAENTIALAFLLTAQAEMVTNAGNWDAVPAPLEEAERIAEYEGLAGLLPLIRYHRGEHEVRMRKHGDAGPWLQSAYTGFLNAGRKKMAGDVCLLIGGAFAYNPDTGTEELEAAAADPYARDKPCRAVALFYRGQRDKIPFTDFQKIGNQTLDTLREAGFESMTPSLLNSLGIAAGRSGEYGTAIRYYDEARAGFAALGDKVSIASVSCNQAKDLSEIGANDDAIRIFEESLEIYRDEVPDRLDLALKAQQEIGLAHERQGRLEEAAQWLEQAMVSSQSFTIRFYDGYVGGDYARVLYKMGHKEEAMKTAEDAIDTLLADQETHAAVAARVLSWLGARRLEAGDVVAAAEALDQASALMDPNGVGADALLDGPGDLYVRMEHAKSVAGLMAAMGEPREANAYAQVALTLSESRFEEEQIKAMANAELQRLLGENEQRLNVMAREAEVSELKLRNTRVKAFAGVGAAIAAGIAALALFRSYRVQKQLTHTKETFLQEIHHRVANNLQLIVSLLRFDEKGDEDSLTDAANRARTMALIHRHVYHQQQDAPIDGAHFMSALIDLLRDALRQPGVSIALDADSAPIDVSSVTPLGLITCEAVSNALKYAFAGRESGLILVRLKDRGATMSLEVSDDGVGAEKAGPSTSTREGRGLMESLAEQVGGRFTFATSENGVSIRVDNIPKAENAKTAARTPSRLQPEMLHA
ncbi:MAG: histidine kinase dimerization/phosphoacceptor domain -containing protein, partial [Pseudomonadota bacterium]